MEGPPDVRFDHAAAADASAACRLVANRLSTATDERSRVGRDTRQSWTGPEAEQFDGLLESELTSARHIVEELRHLAASIDQAATAAREEQRRRERVRAELAEAERRRRAAEQQAREQAAPR